MRLSAARSRRPALGHVVGVVVFLAGTTVYAPNASAGAPACVYDAKTKVVTVTSSSAGPFGYIRLERDGDEILGNEVDCGDATRFNTDKIVAQTSPGVIVSTDIVLAAGRFVPGATNEPGNSDEIEFVLKSDTGAELYVFGTNADDRFSVGMVKLDGGGRQTRANLNAGETAGVDHDVTFKAPDTNLVNFNGSDGNDRLTGAGGAATGAALAARLGLTGSADRDRLVGGRGADDLQGGGANDVAIGGRGVDNVVGQAGDDILRGGAGGDTIRGEAGRDLHFGGPGVDTCQDSEGINDFEGCERT